MKTYKKIMISTMMLSLTALNSLLTQAQTSCYDFDGPALNTLYEVGDTVNTQHAVINLLEFRTGTNLTENAQIIQNDIIEAGPPSLIVRGLTVQVVPDERIRSVTLQYAENAPPNNPQNWNLGANGMLKVWNGTLAEGNTQHLGTQSAGGRVAISVTEEAVPGGNWIRGTLTLESDPVNPLLPNRGIERFAIGRSSQLLMDEVCLSL